MARAASPTPGRETGKPGIPSALSWAYQASLNRETDLLFWQETNYKPNQKLNPVDPRDRAMIPKWWAARAQIERTRSPRDLIRSLAVATVSGLHGAGSQSVVVLSLGAGGSDIAEFSSLRVRRVAGTVRAR